jgi:hypothetical protein
LYIIILQSYRLFAVQCPGGTAIKFEHEFKRYGFAALLPGGRRLVGNQLLHRSISREISDHTGPDGVHRERQSRPEQFVLH